MATETQNIGSDFGRYARLRNELLGIHQTTRRSDYWRDRKQAPLMSVAPFREYHGKPIPNDDVITMDLPQQYGVQRGKPLMGLVCSSTGVGKTRFVKNIIKAFAKGGFRILYIEPKSFEVINARNIGEGQRIHHLDQNESLNVVSYTPAYAYEEVKENYPNLFNRTTFYSPDIRMLRTREIWQSFGLPDKAADIATQMVKDGETDLKRIAANISRRVWKKGNYDPDSLFHATVTSAVSSINNMLGTGLFKMQKKLDIQKEWDDGNAVVVNYFSQDGVFMNTDIGLLINQVRDIGVKESAKGLHHVTRKLIIFDDAFYYAGRDAQRGAQVNLAIKNIVTAQNNFRTFGVNMLLIVQSPAPNAIDPKIIDGCTTKLVSYVENPEALKGKLPPAAYQLVASTRANEGLYTDEDNYIFQWIYVQGKTKWCTGFPFDCTVGH